MTNVIPLFPNDERRELLANILPRVKKFLLYRERSPSEFHRYLTQQMQLSHQDAHIILDWACEEGFIDLYRFTRSRIEHLLGNGKGPNAIRSELGLLGIPLPVSREFLQALSEKEIIQAGLPKATQKLRQLRKNYENEIEIQNRLFRYLQGRGFSFDESRRIYKEICKQEQEDGLQ